MKGPGKRILVISPEAWEGLHMSKHHLALGLAAQGHDVVFLDPPDADAKGIQVGRKQEIQVVTYRHWLRGANQLPKALHMWYYRNLLQKIAQRTGGAFDLIWNFDTSRMQWFPKGMGYRLLHLADYNILHQGMGLVRTADLVIATGQVVKDHVEQVTGVTVHHVGHALDERWLANNGSLHLRTRERPRNVAYAGQLAMHYHDWEGWLELAEHYPSLTFTFIGPWDPHLKEPAFHALRRLANVQFTGLKSKDELIPLLRAADILFFGFRSATLAKERANPHKILEYLSTGNVIVGSYTMEYVHGPALMCMAPQGAPLLATFRDAVERFAELNTPELRRMRIAFAEERSMTALLERISKLMHPT
jgi:glycosyltransferase involved in cell wall biosynthesis